jgi:hypothetical protein
LSIILTPSPERRGRPSRPRARGVGEARCIGNDATSEARQSERADHPNHRDVMPNWSVQPPLGASD